MEKQTYTIEIDAPRPLVWSTMLDDATYRDWTGEFMPGSYYTGSWDEGATIRFLGADSDGSASGMLAVVAANRPEEFVSLEYRGEVVADVDDTTSDRAVAIAGGHENYTFTEQGGVTTVTVDLETTPEMIEIMADLWPKALARLKAIAEARAA